MPRGVVLFGGGYYGYGFWYNPRGKARAPKKEGHIEEEEEVTVTEKRKHNRICYMGSYTFRGTNERTKNSIINYEFLEYERGFREKGSI